MSRTGKKLKLGAVLDGLGYNHMAWQHPAMPSDASENLDFYIKQAQLAESAKFDTLFLVDVSHVGPGNIPHYPSMFEGVSLMNSQIRPSEKLIRKKKNKLL